MLVFYWYKTEKPVRTFKALYLGYDGLVPVGQRPLDGELEGLKHGELLLGGSVLVARIVDDGVVIVVAGLHGRWRGIEGTAPNFDLLFAVLLGRLCLVQTRQTFGKKKRNIVILGKMMDLKSTYA